MSFSPIVAGLIRLHRESAGHDITDLEPAPFPEPDPDDLDSYVAWYYCEGVDADGPGGAPGGYGFCRRTSDDLHEWTVNIADIPFDTDALLFAVLVGIQGPKLTGGALDCEHEGTFRVKCDGTDQPVYDGTISGGGAGDWLYPGETVVAPTFTSPLPPIGSTQTTRTNWPHPTFTGGLARLENPAPTWPVPDAFGNTYGRCLFTLAQLPTAISLAIVRHNHSCEDDGGFGVSIEAYVEGDEDPPLAHPRVFIT